MGRGYLTSAAAHVRRAVQSVLQTQALSSRCSGAQDAGAAGGRRAQGSRRRLDSNSPRRKWSGLRFSAPSGTGTGRSGGIFIEWDGNWQIATFDHERTGFLRPPRALRPSRTTRPSSTSPAAVDRGAFGASTKRRSSSRRRWVQSHADDLSLGRG